MYKQPLQTMARLIKPAIMTLAEEIQHINRKAENNELAREHGLSLVTISWEDTARSKYSCVGPNISDLTLNVGGKRMVMIRPGNFSDMTGDVPIDDFHVTVGNEAGGAELRRVPLKEYLLNLGRYAGAKADAALVRDRDERVLTSAQACILPLGEDGEVEFVPEIYNYQSTSANPAILAIIASAQGTSAHILTGPAQKLHFNRRSDATQFMAKRLKQDRIERGVEVEGGMTSEEADRSALILFQVPLKQRTPDHRLGSALFGGLGGNMYGTFPCSGTRTLECANFGTTRRGGLLKSRAGMDHAMLRSSDVSAGRFKTLSEYDVLLERDDRFPIRATYQYYRVTDDADISPELMADIAKNITSVYERAKEKGSLVIDPSNRVTETKGGAKAKLEPLSFPVSGAPLFPGISTLPDQSDDEEGFVPVDASTF
jgi:hypothetical protein